MFILTLIALILHIPQQGEQQSIILNFKQHIWCCISLNHHGYNAPQVAPIEAIKYGINCYCTLQLCIAIVQHRLV